MAEWRIVLGNPVYSPKGTWKYTFPPIMEAEDRRVLEDYFPFGASPCPRPLLETEINGFQGITRFAHFHFLEMRWLSASGSKQAARCATEAAWSRGCVVSHCRTTYLGVLFCVLHLFLLGSPLKPTKRGWLPTYELGDEHGG